MREFKYDVISLIQSVRDRPCLWDKTLESYKDRVERRAAWEEIFNILDDGYEDMTPEEKRFTGEHVLNKWTNVRDTFIKTLKTKMGRPKRKYILYDHLSFLTKIIPKEEGVCFEESEVPVSFTNETPEKVKKKSKNDTDESEPRKKPKKLDFTDAPTTSSDDYSLRRKSRKKEDSPVDTQDVDFIDDESTEPRIMNEDEAFFASLLPTVVKYDEDDRLEFRIEVLSVMKRIKDKKKWSEEQQL
ncbi:uncharacterized protein LOC115455436 [Manduca sexta]|uniref:uncharacterized protein LOC115455436 n=1 Tax=Manduca sexta TaxID=7130 RepID=UPI00118402F8|nr:uncharacterized protein LOC115455436 [Manduca sexta]